jgi:hypothetical protein
MMATMRDDPENYKEMLQSLKKKSAAAAAGAPPPDTAPARAASPTAGHGVPRVKPGPAPPVKESKSSLPLIIGAVAILVIIFAILWALKVI